MVVIIIEERDRSKEGLVLVVTPRVYRLSTFLSNEDRVPAYCREQERMPEQQRRCIVEHRRRRIYDNSSSNTNSSSLPLRTILPVDRHSHQRCITPLTILLISVHPLTLPLRSVDLTLPIDSIILRLILSTSALSLFSHLLSLSEEEGITG